MILVRCACIAALADREWAKDSRGSDFGIISIGSCARQLCVCYSQSAAATRMWKATKPTRMIGVPHYLLARSLHSALMKCGGNKVGGHSAGLPKTQK